MPAIDLAQGPKTLSRYDVVGVRAEGYAHFVIHVGLLDEDNRSVEIGGDVSAVHMRPPLEQGEAIKVHVAGHVPLRNDEIQEISAWIEEIADEYPNSPRRQYVIHPPWKDVYDRNTGARRYRRYSCAGFVLDGHRQVEIDLLKIDEDTLPDVYPETIMSAYGQNTEQRLRRYGLGPWKVVLAGYVLHALNRPTNQIRQEPYQAQEGDEQF